MAVQRDERIAACKAIDGLPRAPSQSPSRSAAASTAGLSQQVRPLIIAWRLSGALWRPIVSAAVMLSDGDSWHVGTGALLPAALVDVNSLLDRPPGTQLSARQGATE